MRVNIVLDQDRQPYVEVLVTNAKELGKIYNIKYHVDAILKILNRKDEDEDEE